MISNTDPVYEPDPTMKAVAFHDPVEKPALGVINQRLMENKKRWSGIPGRKGEGLHFHGLIRSLRDRQDLYLLRLNRIPFRDPRGDGNHRLMQKGDLIPATIIFAFLAVGGGHFPAAGSLFPFFLVAPATGFKQE